MRAEVTEKEIADYRANGFVVIEGLLDAGELEHWRATVENAIADRGENVLPDRPVVREAVGAADEVKQRAEYYGRVFKQRVNLWKTDSGVRELMLDARLGRIVADLAGVDGVRIWHDQALIKLPCANPTGFHLDVPYWSFHSPNAISLWLAMDDATLQNGCMCYVAGSHKTEGYDNVNIGPAIGAIFDVYPEWRTLPIVHCPIPAAARSITMAWSATGPAPT